MKKQTRSWFQIQVLVSLAVIALAASALGQQERFEDVTTVTVVEVPVQVTVDGEPLRELTKDDFELSDNRKRQEIVGFDLIDLSTTTEIRDDIPVSARRHFLMLFDLAFSEPDSVGRAREAASKLVSDSLHPTDLVAVATYTQARGPQMVLGFTSDRKQILYAITTLGFTTPAEGVVDPLGLVISEIDAELPQPDTGGGQRPAEQIIAENARDMTVLLVP